LQAEAILRVATETFQSRQLLHDQVSALASNKLKSELDASFTEVGLQESKLALLKSENDVQSSFATLAALLDMRKVEAFRLAEEPSPGPLTNNTSEIISAALSGRPELLRLRLERDSTLKFARAERGLHYPNLSLQGTAGVIPYSEGGLNRDFVAGGVVLNVPLFSGNLYDAKEKAAALRAQAAEAALQDEENNVVRDARIAWLNASNAYERVGVSTKLLEVARLNYTLADASYKAGASSIISMNRAQLYLTTAEVTLEAARYEYFIRRSILAFQTGQLR